MSLEEKINDAFNDLSLYLGKIGIGWNFTELRKLVRLKIDALKFAEDFIAKFPPSDNDSNEKNIKTFNNEWEKKASELNKKFFDLLGLRKSKSISIKKADIKTSQKNFTEEKKSKPPISETKSKQIVMSKIIFSQKSKVIKCLKNFFNAVYRAVQDEYATIDITNTTNYKYYTQDLVFAERNPSHYDVIQGRICDCFLHAALITLAKKSPKIIRNCIEYKPGDQFAYVKLYRLIEQNLKYVVKPVKISVDVLAVYNYIYGDDTQPKYKKSHIKGYIPIWPEVIEDAYSQFIKKGWDLEHKRLLEGICGLDSKNLDEGGAEYCLMFAITGKISKSIETKNSKDKTIIDIIKRKLRMKQYLTCSFEKEFTTQDIKSGEKIQIYDGHAYAIVGIDENKKYVRLIEPNKVLGRKIENSPKSKEGGHIAMSYKDFENNYREVDYATNKIKI